MGGLRSGGVESFRGRKDNLGEGLEAKENIEFSRNSNKAGMPKERGRVL